MKTDFDYKKDDMIKGYYKREQQFCCLYCETTFEEGLIYPAGEIFQTAEHAMNEHVYDQHGSPLDALLALNKRYTGLSEHQTELLHYFASDFLDKDIATQMGISASTIRNHRFKLREKERQAETFLAIMALIDKPKPFSIHKGATMVDERYAITEEERAKVLATFIDSDGRVKQLPTKEKRKIVILQEVIKKFEANRNYTEKEVNEILKQIFDDHVTVRRYLIQYGFMHRSTDCQSYWI
ncbi:DUF2087 domain-containing protein [Solibacillus sp. CAU 1738]|uniref:DUF2087 domain-containing protein n=1 Tax=Solibacillus sp. CAU 1738 TaxID=3140363 RepID=UPI0032601A80